jgi:hypothetical protein
VLCVALGIAGCEAAVSAPLRIDAADPRARVPPSRYVPVTAGTRMFLPVEPLPWQDLNRKAAPRRSGQGEQTR